MKLPILSQISVAAVFTTLSMSAPAADHLLLYGLDVGNNDSHYAYGGLILPFGENASLTNDSWRARVWFYDLGYEYERSITQPDVEGDASGFEAGIGRQWTGQNTFGSLYLSLAYRSTDTSPFDPLNEAEGTDTGLKLQGEITHNLGESWMLQGMASYTGGDDFDDTWVRLRAGYKNGNYTFGPELTGLDGPDYDATRVGIFIDGFTLGESTSVGFSVGAHDGNGTRGSDGEYFNIGFATKF